MHSTTVVSYTDHPVFSHIGSSKFSTDVTNCKFPTQEIMGAQNSNFALNFPPKLGFSANYFQFFDEDFFHKKKIFRQFSDS